MKKALIPALLILLLLAVGIDIKLRHTKLRAPTPTTQQFEDSDAALVAATACNLLATYNLTFPHNGPVVLEQRSCLPTFHAGKIEAHTGPFANDRGEVLLVEKKDGLHTTILAAYFTDENFRRIEPGITAKGTEVVLWSAMVQCGSCHSGPEGILMENPRSGKFEWNQDWSPENEQAIKNTLTASAYLDEGESLFWNEFHNSLYVRAEVNSGQPHCCPHGGIFSAQVNVDAGKPVLDTLFYDGGAEN